MCAKSLQLCITLWPYGLYPGRLLCPWDFPGKDTGVGCHALLQGIFPTQGLNQHRLRCQADSLPLSHLGSFMKKVCQVNERMQVELLSFPVSYCWVFKNYTHNHQQPETIDFPVRLKIMRTLSLCVLTNSINMWITYESKEHKINPSCLDHSRPCHRWLGIVPLRALSNSECQSAYCDLSDYGIWSVERFLEEGFCFFFLNLSGKP